MSTYIKKQDGIRYHPSYGRLMEHRGHSLRIYWNNQMLDYLRRHFPTMLNDELAGCLGVSSRTVVRKARELGLQKDPEWLAVIWAERRRLGQIISKRNGNYPGKFKKGEHRNPAGEFKTGHQLTDEQKAKRSESVRKYYRTHPHVAKAKALKAWETRRSKQTI